MTKRIPGILLAAEAGRGWDSRRRWWSSGRTLAERGVALLRDSGADPVLVVTGAFPSPCPGRGACTTPTGRPVWGRRLLLARAFIRRR